MKLLQLFLEQLPDRKSILGIYAVIVTMVYSWTLFASFYQLPAWMFYLDMKQIVSIYAYAFSINILESILLLTFILLLEITIFHKLVRKNFQLRSTIIVLVLLGSSMLRLAFFGDYTEISIFVSGQLAWWFYTIIFGVLLFITALKVSVLKRIFEGFAERATVFLYIYLPLSIVSIVIIIFRNLD